MASISHQSVVDIDAISNWISRFAQQQGHLLIVKRSGDYYPAATFRKETFAEECAAIADVAAQTDVYLRVTTTSRAPERFKRGDANDASVLVGLWADLDHAEGCHKPDPSLTLPPDRQACLNLLEELPAPTVVIDTTGGLQVWWMFDQPLSIETLGGHEALRRLAGTRPALIAGKAAEYGWHVDNVADLARILRIPGTLNHKWARLDPPQPPRLVHILTDDGPTYPLAVVQELIKAAAPATVPEPTPRHATPTVKHDQPVESDPVLFALSGEDLTWWETKTSWEDLLCPQGWTVYQRKPGGETWWTRPNADRTTTPKSAVTGYRGHDVLTVHTSASDLPSGPGQGLTKLRVFAHYHHRGDLEEAGKAIKALWRDAHPLPAVMPTHVTMPQRPQAGATHRVGNTEVPLLGSRRAHSENATRWLVERAHRDGLPIVVYRDGEWWAWINGCWKPQRDEDITDAMRPYFDTAIVLDKDKNPQPVAPDNALMANLLTALRAQARHHGLTGDPWDAAWIGFVPDGYPAEAADLIPFTNGLLHWPTRVLYPHHARLWITHQLDCEWVPNPGPPDALLTILEAQFAGEDDSLEFLQELAGYVIVGATWAEKMFGLIGAKRSGKSTFADTLAMACGRENVATMSVTSFDSTHGTSGLLGKKLIVLNETRTSGGGAGAVRDLLSISGGDSIQINRKYKDPVTAKVRANILAHSNELPTFMETSGALAGRFLWGHFTKSFFGKENPDLKRAALQQIPEFIEWALRGYVRLVHRGHFVQPQRGLELAQEFEEASSPVRRFINEVYILTNMEDAERSRDVYADYQNWCVEAGHKALSEIKFAQAVRASFPESEIRKGDRKLDGRGIKHWFGIRRATPRPVAYQPLQAF
ncbi:phage/plasmid primase, P4 family [Stomatohabitans albus]|uniref:DNA primase family protein n=1 Tax=Stomatohabitans albus TaxID=3110766 RepID=UPI00300C4057